MLGCTLKPKGATYPFLEPKRPCRLCMLAKFNPSKLVASAAAYNESTSGDLGCEVAAAVRLRPLPFPLPVLPVALEVPRVLYRVDWAGGDPGAGVVLLSESVSLDDESGALVAGLVAGGSFRMSVDPAAEASRFDALVVGRMFFRLTP